MAGTVSFIFDDGFLSHRDVFHPVFVRHGLPMGVAVMTGNLGKNRLSAEDLIELQRNGCEIISHTVTHPRLDTTLTEERAVDEIVGSKKTLEGLGLKVSMFVSPCSSCDAKWMPLVEKNYEGAFTTYCNSKTEAPEKWSEPEGKLPYRLHRACLSGMTVESLLEGVREAEANDRWLVFYDHDAGVGENCTQDKLEKLLCGIEKTSVSVLRPTDALKKRI